MEQHEIEGCAAYLYHTGAHNTLVEQIQMVFRYLYKREPSHDEVAAVFWHMARVEEDKQ